MKELKKSRPLMWFWITGVIFGTLEKCSILKEVINMKYSYENHQNILYEWDFLLDLWIKSCNTWYWL